MAIPIPPKPQEPSLSEFGKSILANARDAAFIAAIFLYFAGFMYRYMYRQVWGITSSDGDPAFFGYLVYSYQPLEASWGWLLGISAALVIILVVLGALSRRWGPERVSLLLGLRTLSVSAAVVGFFATLLWGASAASVAAFQNIRQGNLPGTFLVFKDPKQSTRVYGTQFMTDNSNDLLTIVEETKDSYYVLDQPGMVEKPIPDGKLFVIPKQSIAFVTRDVVTPGIPH